MAYTKLREVKKCSCRMADGFEISIEPSGDEACITSRKGKGLFAHTKHKNVKTEVLQNLDIIFKDVDIEKECTPAQNCDIIEATIAEKDVILYNSDDADEQTKTLFADVLRYLKAYFERNIEPYEMRYHSFDGGGPEYHFSTDMNGIFTWYGQRIYARADHDRMCGSGFDVVFTLYPLRPGMDEGKITGFSPICPATPEKVEVTVDDDLTIHVKKSFTEPPRGVVFVGEPKE